LIYATPCRHAAMRFSRRLFRRYAIDATLIFRCLALMLMPLLHCFSRCRFDTFFFSCLSL